jgi:5-methylcytosine-specific restriction protein A
MAPAPRRPHMSQKRRAAIFSAHNGVCYLCGGKIQAGEGWDAEHVIAWEISSDDSDDNLRPAHRRCHAPKTAKDAAVIAKLKRMKAKHEGSWPRSRAPLRSRGFSPTRKNEESR